MSSTTAAVSAAATAANNSTAAIQTSGPGGNGGQDVPSEKTLISAARLAIEQDKPVLLDYYMDTRKGTAFLGEDPDTQERILVKSAEEYTSPVQKVFKSPPEYIILTENSIYIVHGSIKKKVITTGGVGPSGGDKKTV